jgi:hypothetical protein
MKIRKIRKLPKTLRVVGWIVADGKKMIYFEYDPPLKATPKRLLYIVERASAAHGGAKE